MKILLWLDDSRNPSKDDWLNFSPIGKNVEVVWVKSYLEFVDYIMNIGLPTAICFDHDLGEDVSRYYRSTGASKKNSRKIKKLYRSGMDCAKWLVGYCMNTKQLIPLYNIQSANPVGKENIDSLLKNYIKYNELI